MRVLMSLLFVVCATVDVFVIGMSYGMKHTAIQFRYNLLISAVAGIGTYLSMLFGSSVSSLFSPQVGNTIGGIILLSLGCKLLWDAVKPKKEPSGFFETLVNDPSALDLNHSGTIEAYEMLVLAGVLALNNVGLGIGASLADLSIGLVSILSAVCSVIFLLCGHYVGEKCSRGFLSGRADTVSALIIMLLGGYILLIPS